MVTISIDTSLHVAMIQIDYDKQREQLQNVTFEIAGQTAMDNKYQYDAVDNILGITNAASPQNLTNINRAKLGGASTHTYQYDALNRLIKADGKAKDASYSMSMTFGKMSEPLTKVQKVDSSKTAQSYNFAYKYEDENHPTAPTQATETAVSKLIAGERTSFKAVVAETLINTGLGHILPKSYLMKATAEARHDYTVALEMVEKYTHRKHPNAKLIRNAQEELTNYKAVYRLLLSFTTGTEYVQKKTTRKSQEQLPQNYGGK